MSSILTTGSGCQDVCNRLKIKCNSRCRWTEGQTSHRPPAKSTTCSCLSASYAHHPCSHQHHHQSQTQSCVKTHAQTAHNRKFNDIPGSISITRRNLIILSGMKSWHDIIACRILNQTATSVCESLWKSDFLGLYFESRTRKLYSTRHITWLPAGCLPSGWLGVTQNRRENWGLRGKTGRTFSDAGRTLISHGLKPDPRYQRNLY